MAVHKTKTGYQIWYYDPDGRFRKKTFRGVDRREAERLEQELLAARDRGERPYNEREVPTLNVFSKTWIEECRSGWKPSTLQQYEQVLASQLLPEFGDRRLSNIAESAVRQWVTRLQDAKLSARRINLALLVLKMILRTALRRRMLREDRLAGVKMLKEPQTEVDPFDPADVETFLAACPAWWRPYFTVALWTGARPNELAALKWGDVDWTRGLFRIRAGRYRGVEGPPKTPSSVRDVDLLQPVREALIARQQQQAAMRMRAGLGAPEREKDYVFTGPDGGLLNVNYLRERIWYATLKTAKLRRRTMYQTRHTFASNALAAGEAPSWVAGMLGHTTPEMLFQVYARFIPNRTRRDGSALLGRMSGGSTETPGPAEQVA